MNDFTLHSKIVLNKIVNINHETKKSPRVATKFNTVACFREILKKLVLKKVALKFMERF